MILRLARAMLLLSGVIVAVSAQGAPRSAETPGGSDLQRIVVADVATDPSNNNAGASSANETAPANDTTAGDGEQGRGSHASVDDIHVRYQTDRYVLGNGGIVVTTLIKIYRGNNLITVDTHVTRVSAKEAAAGPKP